MIVLLENYSEDNMEGLDFLIQQLVCMKQIESELRHRRQRLEEEIFQLIPSQQTGRQTFQTKEHLLIVQGQALDVREL